MDQIEIAARALCELDGENPEILLYDCEDIEDYKRRKYLGTLARLYKAKPGVEPKALWTFYAPQVATTKAALALDEVPPRKHYDIYVLQHNDSLNSDVPTYLCIHDGGEQWLCSTTNVAEALTVFSKEDANSIPMPLTGRRVTDLFTLVPLEVAEQQQKPKDKCFYEILKKAALYREAFEKLSKKELTSNMLMASNLIEAHIKAQRRRTRTYQAMLT